MDDFDFYKPEASEDDIVLNSKLEHLYNHSFGDGRFFQVVFSDEGETHIKFAPRTMIKVVYIKDKENIEGLEIIKLISDREKERIKLSKFNLQQLKCFLDFINTIDLKGVSEKRIALADESLTSLDNETKKKISTLLSGEEGGMVIRDLLNKGIITNVDLVNTGYRKLQLEEFRKLLFEDGITDYKEKIGKPNTKDEIAWQHFFKVNEWIFGYGLDYRFQGILQKEFHASDTSASGKDGVRADYLLGDKRFTTFVELKRPDTRLFGISQKRANC